MSLLTKPALAFQVAWMLLALAGGILILGDSLGYAAWNGVNFVMVIYLIVALIGCVGLIVAIIKSTSRRSSFAWIGALSSFAIASVALIFLWDFVFRRDSSLPINESVKKFGIHAPLLAFYSFSICACTIQFVLSLSNFDK